MKIEKKPIMPNRIRTIRGSFAFIEHAFLRCGFWADLGHHELLLYVFLVLVADRQGLSYYSYDKICMLLRITLDEYILARNTLISEDLIAFDGQLFQVLSLPRTSKLTMSKPLREKAEMVKDDPATIRQIIDQAFVS
jgi:hypothetical protein